VFAQATITLTDSNCSDFSLGGSPGARTLTCVVNTVPVCTVNAPANGTIGSNVTISANCSPAATSWAWTGGNIGSCSTQNCQDNGNGMTNGSVATYKVTGTNGAGTGGQSNGANVTWSNTPPAAPSGCTVAPGSSNQSAGYQASFTVTCSGGGAPTSWAWNGGGSSSCNTATCGPLTFNNTATVNVTASNAGGNGNQASSTITIGGGGGGGWNGVCSNVSGTTYVVTAAWVGGTGWVFDTALNGISFGPNDIIVAKVTPPATKPQAAGSAGALSVIEFMGPPGTRWGSLSTLPCDLNGTGLIVKKDLTPPMWSGQNAPPTIATWVGTSQPSHSVLLVPGVEYYYNITNQNPNGGTGCNASACDVRFTFVKPGGT
jgi:hypothetical protein